MHETEPFGKLDGSIRLKEAELPWAPVILYTAPASVPTKRVVLLVVCGDTFNAEAMDPILTLNTSSEKVPVTFLTRCIVLVVRAEYNTF